MSEIDWIEDLKTVNLKPGDVLVLKTNQPIHEEAVGRIKKQLSGIFPGHKVLILAPGIELGVVSPETPVGKVTGYFPNSDIEIRGGE